MKLKTLLFRIAIAIFVITLLFFINIYINSGPKKSVTYKGIRKIFIQNKNGNYTIIKNGQPFIVKGGAGYTHIKELALCGGNTIMCWDTSKIESTLQEAAKYHVSVIIGLDIPGTENVDFYNDEKNVASLINTYKKIIVRYKNDSSVLAWCLGNELLLPLKLTLTPPAFYKVYNTLLSMMHDLDPDHPVSTAMMNIPKKAIISIQWRIPALDFISINTYNKIKTIEQDINKLKFFWQGPYLLTEWAPNGAWEVALTSWDAAIEATSTKKAEQFYEYYTKYLPLKNPRFLGSLAFFWGTREEYTHTWYSIFAEDGTPTEIKETLNDCWKNTITIHKSPNLQYMLIDSLGAKDNIIIKSGSIHKASIFLNKIQPRDSLIYSWQIIKEDWQNWGRTYNNFQKPMTEPSLLSDSTKQFTSFTAPSKEGPYRVFVTVYNVNGYCATANTPIYIVKE